MGKAVQHPLALCNLSYCKAVVLLVKKKACFLPVYIVHGIFYPVFSNFSHAAKVCPQSLSAVKALVLLHTFEKSDFHVVSLVNCGNLLAHFRHYFYQQPIQHILYFLRAEGKHLGYNNIPETVNGKSRKAVRLPENKSATGKILSHNRFSVFESIAYSSLVKCLVELVVRITGNYPYSDF